MIRVHDKQKESFLAALGEYDSELAVKNLGIIPEVTFWRTRDTKANIFMTFIGFIIGIFTGHGFFQTGGSVTGSLVLSDDGAHFFATEAEIIKEDGKRERRLVIQGNVFLPYEAMRRAKSTRNIVLAKELRIFGSYTDSDSEREVGYRLEIMTSAAAVDKQYIETLTNKLTSNNVKIKKGKKLLAAAVVVVVVLFIGFLSGEIGGPSGEILPVVTVEGDTYVSPDGNYQLTFVGAYRSVLGVGQRQTDVILIHIDYLALTAHRVHPRPVLRGFVVYHGDDVLENWGGGYPAGERGLFNIQRDFEAGETFLTMAAVIPADSLDSIRIARYNANGQLIFTYELIVGDLED